MPFALAQVGFCLLASFPSLPSIIIIQGKCTFPELVQRCVDKCLGGGLLLGCQIGDLLAAEESAASSIATFMATTL